MRAYGEVHEKHVFGRKTLSAVWNELGPCESRVVSQTTFSRVAVRTGQVDLERVQVEIKCRRGPNRLDDAPNRTGATAEAALKSCSLHQVGPFPVARIVPDDIVMPPAEDRRVRPARNLLAMYSCRGFTNSVPPPPDGDRRDQTQSATGRDGESPGRRTRARCDPDRHYGGRADDAVGRLSTPTGLCDRGELKLVADVDCGVTRVRGIARECDEKGEVDVASAYLAQLRLRRDDQDFVRAVRSRDSDPVPGAQVVESELFHDLLS